MRRLSTIRELRYSRYSHVNEWLNNLLITSPLSTRPEVVQFGQQAVHMVVHMVIHSAARLVAATFLAAGGIRGGGTEQGRRPGLKKDDTHARCAYFGSP